MIIEVNGFVEIAFVYQQFQRSPSAVRRIPSMSLTIPSSQPRISRTVLAVAYVTYESPLFKRSHMFFLVRYVTYDTSLINRSPSSVCHVRVTAEQSFYQPHMSGTRHRCSTGLPVPYTKYESPLFNCSPSPDHISLCSA